MNNISKAPEIGHNQPPEPTPYEAAVDDIDTLYIEAANWQDGTEIKTQADADAVSRLLDISRKEYKKADAARKLEALPFDEGKKEVQARYKPLLERATLIGNICKQALAPFLAKQEAIAREAERKAQEEAEAAERAAQEAFAKANATNIAEREEAERLAEIAKNAEINRKVAAKVKGTAKGGVRAVSLRTVYDSEITDFTAVARFYWEHNQSDLHGFFTGLVERDVRAGKRDIPGVEITERKVAV